MKTLNIIFIALFMHLASANAMLPRCFYGASKVLACRLILASSSNIKFDRETMNDWDEKKGWKVEGYWASSKNPDEDTFKGKYPFPQPHETPFQGKDEFLKKLNEIEHSATKSYGLSGDKKHQKIIINSYRGLSFSRLEEGVPVGSQEFQDHEEKVVWPEAFSSYYVEKFNVRPSAEFFEYVMNKNLSE